MAVLRPPLMRLLLGAALVFAPPAALAQAPSASAPVAPPVKTVAPPAGSSPGDSAAAEPAAPSPAPSQADAEPAAPSPAPSQADAELEAAERALDAELAAREAARASQRGASGDLQADAEDSESLGWTLVRTLLVLGVVVASIYLTLNVGLRRLMGLQGVAAGRQPLMSVVERLPLDQRRSLFVVKAADEYLLLGGGEGGLQLLSKLDVEAVERIRAQRPQTNAVPLSPFLQKLLSRRSGGSPSQPPGS
ncbi:flagellar biosynthetic protein FliO [Corallococcus macrosporus]|nr:flagellar biosynthetic protein FliO [Corallococcus macrosporus]